MRSINGLPMARRGSIIAVPQMYLAWSMEPQIDEAFDRMLRGDVRYRFVIDMASLG